MARVAANGERRREAIVRSLIEAWIFVGAMAITGALLVRDGHERGSRFRLAWGSAVLLFAGIFLGYCLKEMGAGK